MADREEHRIHRLDPTVVNRIAAGEVIQRPENAVKELIENSIDAGATSISIVAKGGGMKMLQIQDDGCGISYSDLAIVCERFTTSKLKSFEDLQNMQTFGFRGEALASVTHIAHMTITSRTAGSKCAFRAKYVDGVLVGEKPNLPARPVATAGVKGTTILIEDLFFNVLTRKNSLKNATDEYNRILQVVTRYAVQYPSISFGCKKFGANSADVQTQKNSTAASAIRILFGNEIAKSLLEFELNKDSPTYNQSLSDIGFQAKGFVTSPNFHRRKGTFILFINQRLVESSSIKKGIENVYQNYLPKHTHPFMYISISIKPQHIDVNVHPTKKEVHFMKESEIIENLQKEIEQKLLGPNSSRTYTTHMSTPAALSSLSSTPKNTSKSDSLSSSSSSSSTKRLEEDPLIYQHQKVRTDSRSQTLEAFLAAPSDRSLHQSVPQLLNRSDGPLSRKRHRENSIGEANLPLKRRLSAVDVNVGASDIIDVPDSESLDDEEDEMLTSIRGLLSKVEQSKHLELTKTFRTHTFVGCANVTFSLIQHATKLYIVDMPQVSEELFYQSCLRLFSRFPRIGLSPPIPLETVLECYLQSVDPKEGEKGEIPIQEQLMSILSLLYEKSELLSECFSIDIDSEGLLSSLPLILPSFSPLIDGLPQFILRLANEVNWEDETDCFDGISRALSSFYSLKTTSLLSNQTGSPLPSKSSNHPTKQEKRAGGDPGSYRWAIEHSLFPAARSLIAPQRFVGEGVVLEIACLENLYKIFERC